MSTYPAPMSKEYCEAVAEMAALATRLRLHGWRTEGSFHIGPNGDKVHIDAPFERIHAAIDNDSERFWGEQSMGWSAL